jgi:hypothetical protein
MTIPHPGLSPSALAGNGRYARAFPCRPVHSQPHLLGIVLSPNLLRPEKVVVVGVGPVWVAGGCWAVAGQLARVAILTRLWVNTPCPHQIAPPACGPGGCGPSRSRAVRSSFCPAALAALPRSARPPPSPRTGWSASSALSDAAPARPGQGFEAILRPQASRSQISRPGFSGRSNLVPVSGPSGDGRLIRA